LHVYTLLESIAEFMCVDKIEFINVAFLLKDASIEVVYVKLPIVPRRIISRKKSAEFRKKARLLLY
jgi:hypothetical protein